MESKTTNSQTTTNALPANLPENTNTFQRVYLSSSRAGIHLGPYHKTWTLPPMNYSARTKHRMILTGLNLFHHFPSIPTTQTIHYRRSGDNQVYGVTIERGNWTAKEWAAHLTAFFAKEPETQDQITVTYDESNLHFTFDPAITIVNTTDHPTTCLRQMGFPEFEEAVIGESMYPVNFASVTEIIVVAQWSVANLPYSGILARVPVEGDYTERLSYYNPDTSGVSLVMSHHLHTCDIKLYDQEGEPLERWIPPPGSNLEKEVQSWNEQASPPWSLELALQQLEREF